MPLDMDAMFVKPSMKKVELLQTSIFSLFIDLLTEWINRKDISIIDLKYSTCFEDGDHWNKALIFYKELDSDNSDGD